MKIFIEWRSKIYIEYAYFVVNTKYTLDLKFNKSLNFFFFFKYNKYFFSY